MRYLSTVRRSEFVRQNVKYKSGVSNSGARPVQEGPVLLPEEIQTKLKHHGRKTKVDRSPRADLGYSEGETEQTNAQGKEKIANRAGR